MRKKKTKKVFHIQRKDLTIHLKLISAGFSIHIKSKGKIKIYILKRNLAKVVQSHVNIYLQRKYELVDIFMKELTQISQNLLFGLWNLEEETVRDV